MRRKIFVFGLVALVLVPTISYAASQGYSSYLYLPSNVQVEGSSRSYDYAKHKVSIDVNKIYDTYNPQTVVISINKKNLIGSTQKNRIVKDYSVGSTLRAELGNQGKGKFWYGFGSFKNALKDGNEGHGIVYAGIESENVVMTSYN